MLINRTKVKEIVGSIQISKEFSEELEKQVEDIIQKACKRATANNRTTIMARDL
jgi:histone H3/H4